MRRLGNLHKIVFLILILHIQAVYLLRRAASLNKIGKKGQKDFTKEFIKALNQTEFNSIEKNIGFEYLELDAKIVSLDTKNHSLFKSVYTTPDQRLISNLQVYDLNGKFLFQINREGLKGSRRRKDTKHIAVWGDSIVFGIERGWTDLASDKNTIYFNGGVEGCTAPEIIRNALALNHGNFYDLNLVSIGWHSRQSITTIVDSLNRALQLPRLTLMTNPISISVELSELDLANYFKTTPSFPGEVISSENYFGFWGSEIYSKKNCRQIICEIERQNKIIRAFARVNNVPVLDLEHIFGATRTIDQFREYFFDLGHPRLKTYPILAYFLREFVKIHL